MARISIGGSLKINKNYGTTGETSLYITYDEEELNEEKIRLINKKLNALLKEDLKEKLKIVDEIENKVKSGGKKSSKNFDKKANNVLDDLDFDFPKFEVEDDEEGY